jgi:membrane-bound serine protease (ClpP class)
MRSICLLGLVGLAALLSPLLGSEATPARHRVIVVPIRDEISEPAFYILRRGLKAAAADPGQVVVLDLKTPGGAIDTTLKMMEALEQFPGQTIAYVDNEAVSAGAIISAVTDEIWFSPTGVMGAAAPVSSTGQDIDSTMKQKMVSYLKARVRAVTAGKGYRGDVVSAMIDADSALVVGGKTLKPKGGELLSLTAAEASATYGSPPRPLLSAGTAKNVNDLLTQKFGAGNFVVVPLAVTWSENFAVVLIRYSSVLLGLGLFGLFVAFKTSSFGTFGVGGLVLLAAVFLSSSVAGLSGHEPIFLFGFGVLLLALEVIFFHTAGVLGVFGALLIFASLFWAMADLWPHQPLHTAWADQAFVTPLANVAIGMVIAVALALLAARFLPRAWFWERLAVNSTNTATTQYGALPAEASVVGRTARALTTLAPSGYVEIDGRRYEAFCQSGLVRAGAELQVVGLDSFRVIVAPPTASSASSSSTLNLTS